MATFLEEYGEVFDLYDDLMTGEIKCKTLHTLYSKVRPPGIRLAQVHAGLDTIYGKGMSDVLERDDFEEALMELDRRFFLLQDLEWEYKILTRADGLISENDAKLLFTATHEQNFSLYKFEQWVKKRRVKGSGVPFTEIDVELCNKPTPDEIIATLPTIPRERTQLESLTRSATTLITDKTKSHARKKKVEKLGYLKKLQELKAKRSQNIQRRKSIEDGYKKSEEERKLEEEERRKREAEEERKRLEEEKRKEEERAAAIERQRLKDLEDQAEAERQREEQEKRAAEEEEERKEREAEEEELRKQREEEERLRKEKEEEDARIKKAEEEEEEKRRQKEEEEEEKRRQKEEEEEEKRRQKEAEAAAAAEAERKAQEELAKLSDKADRDVLQSKLDEEKALQAMKDADAALQAAKTADNMAAIEEAQRMKREADEKARTMKMIKRLKEAIQKMDLRELEDAIRDAKKKKIKGVEEPLAEAEELVNLIYAQRQLENACIDRSIDDIEIALEKVKSVKKSIKSHVPRGFETLLAKEVNEAELLLKRLKRLEFLKRQVMELKQQTIAELKSYSQPPPVVKFVMTATFLILGHSAKEIKQWPQLVVLMGKTGKESLKRRVQSYEPDTMPWDVAEACQEILAGMDTGSVADVSAGAAAFYVWCDGMVSERLTLPKVITSELRDQRRKSLNREESNKNLTKGRTVEVLSRRSRSRDKLDAPKNKIIPNRSRSNNAPAAGNKKNTRSGARSKSTGNTARSARK